MLRTITRSMYELEGQPDTYLGTPLGRVMHALRRASILGHCSDGARVRRLGLPDKLAALSVAGTQRGTDRQFRIDRRRYPSRRYKAGPSVLYQHQRKPDVAIEIAEQLPAPAWPARHLASVALYYHPDKTGFRKVRGWVDTRDGSIRWTHVAPATNYPDGEDDPARFGYGPDEPLETLGASQALTVHIDADRVVAAIADAVWQEAEERLRRQRDRGLIT